MGIIIRNGIEYGGKTFEDMTYEEYQALPEAVKNDGAIRHIYDRDINHAFIDDTISSDDMTWSSNKLKASLNGLIKTKIVQIYPSRLTWNNYNGGAYSSAFQDESLETAFAVTFSNFGKGTGSSSLYNTRHLLNKQAIQLVTNTENPVYNATDRLDFIVAYI